MLYCPKEEEKVVKVIFLDIDGVLTHTDYLNWQTSWYEGGLQEKDVAEAVRILQNKKVRPECT